uniref:Uncharacterized protein n=1 Tax=Setaria digitata TaxID=48799 RepID=A0A915PK65_9BILA
MERVNTLLANAIDIVEEARKSVDRQNQISAEIETEVSRFTNEINQQSDRLYSRICKVKEDYKDRIEFLKNMCHHYTGKLSHHFNALAFDENEIRQKLSKLEWDLIFLQCVGQSFIKASSCYLSETYFDKIENLIHKTKNRLSDVEKLLTNNYNILTAYGTTPSSVPLLTSKKIIQSNGDTNKLIEALQLICNAIEKFQQLPPCIIKGTMNEGEYVDQCNLMDEANKLLIMSINILQRIANSELVSTNGTSNIVSTSTIKTALSNADKITDISELRSNEK